MVLASLFLVVIVAGALVWYCDTPKWNTADGRSILWQVGLSHFETGFAAADGKVFIGDAWGNLFCYDAASGSSLWNATTAEGGGCAGGQVSVYDGKVYVAALGLEVDRFDEDTGVLEMRYPVPNDYSTPYKMVPTFFIADQKMFASDGNTLAVYDLEDGAILWSNYFRTGHTMYDASKALPESNYTYVIYDSNDGLTKGLNSNTGNEIWQYPGHTLSSPITFQQQIILWNLINSNGAAIICLNAKTGHELWHFDAGRIFAPTVYNDLLLFGSEDNCYYALNMSDGSLKWKSNVGCVVGSVPFIDEVNQRLSWEVLNKNSQGSYFGTALSLSLQDGSVLASPNLMSVQAILGQDNAAKLNNHVFATIGKTVICLDAVSGLLLWERTFDHTISQPLLLEDKVFVTADLYLIAYK